MWPSMFGPGWGWGVLVTSAFLFIVLGILGFLFVVIYGPPRQAEESVEHLWHRFEEGDLTRQEFERYRRAGRARLSAREAHK
ncbi:MAG: insulinase family protein [Bacillati bacterium ANGP1]|uniref:Insulinase family protein n=1 Tax=Candidatus Segetimicrobium genomatis TaxID=2569760 RepID=A0A537JT55_9BACT|nr:MAG: insulinase family protein [Terrabacteria group bacterium ANGP1]